MLNHNDIEIYLQLLYVPAYAFGDKEFEALTSMKVSQLISFIDNLKQVKKEQVIKEESLDKNNLLKFCNAALKVIEEFDDLHTLTGYNRTDVELALKKLSL